MKTVKHFTQAEIEELLQLECGRNDHRDGGPKRTAKIIVELEYYSGDPHGPPGPPGARVKTIRAEVTEE